MTAMLAKRDITVIPYRATLPEGFICPEPDGRPDSMYQSPVIDECGHILRDHFSARADVLVDTGGFVFYDSGNLNRRVRPDLYVAHGVEAATIFARNGYFIWEAGKPPDFALEVASESTHREDTGRKHILYADMGVGEYWRFDPTAAYYGYSLAGDRLVNGAYQSIPLATSHDGIVWGYSPALNLNLCARDGRLVFHDPDTDQYLLNLPETKYALEERNAALEERNVALEERNVALSAAKAEVERLREELRRRPGP